MAKGIKSKQKDQAAGLTKEIIGMAILLFSILSFLCFLTGDLIFYNVGSAVQGFFFGLFGYYSFFVLAGLVFWGIRLVIGRRLFGKKTRRYLWLAAFFAFFVSMIVHCATSYDKALTFSQNFSACYGRGGLDFATATPCGSVAILLLHPISRIASVVGTYILFSLLTALIVLLMFKDAIKKAAAKKEGKESKPKKEKPVREKRRRATTSETDGDDEDEQLYIDPSAFDQGQDEEPSKPTLPGYIVGDFGIKTKRDYRQESGNVDVFSGAFDLRNGQRSGGQRSGYGADNVGRDTDYGQNRTYSDAYRSDLSPEANYIMTPPPFNPEYLGNRPISSRNSYTQQEGQAAPATQYDNTSLSGTVYTVPGRHGTNKNNGNNDFSSRADRSYGNTERVVDRDTSARGGLFDNTAARGRTDGYDTPPRSGSRQFGQLGEIVPEKQEEADALTNEINGYTAPGYVAPDGGAAINEEIRNVPGVEKAYTPLSPNTFNATAVARNRGEAGGQRRTREDTQPYDRREDVYPAHTSRGNLPEDDDVYEGQRGGIGQSRPREDIQPYDRREDLYPAHTSRGNLPEDDEVYEGQRGGIGQSRPDRSSRDDLFTRDRNSHSVTEAGDGAVFIEEPPAPVVSDTASIGSSRDVGSISGDRQSAIRSGIVPQKTNVQPMPPEPPAFPSVTLPEEEEEDDGSMSIDQMPLHYRYKAPPLDLLNDVEVDRQMVLAERERLKELAQSVEQNFCKRGISVTLENIVYGMSVTRFEYSIPTVVSVKAITSAQSDLAVWLHAKGDIRILAPIPGTSKIGIEVPNQVSSTVVLKDILRSPQFKKIPQNGIHITLGKNIMGESVFLNLTGMPHLLVAGATGTGKSVFLNSLLVSLLYTYSPEDLRIVIVDPKQLEFVEFEGIPHLLFNKIITKPEEAAAFLDYLANEMDNRYALFAKARVKKLSEYNETIDRKTQRKLPYIVLIIDEFADLMAKSQAAKKSMEASITRLAALARAAGISLVFATQRPTTDVVDGTIKNNFPARICFKTADYTNSQVVLDERGAEKLLGKGDLMYKVSGPTERAQGALVETNEIRAVVKYVKENNKCFYDKECLALIKKAAKEIDGEAQASEGGAQLSMDMGDAAFSSDPAAMPVVYRRAVRLVITQNTTSKSMLQTKLGIGYNKAARIIDWMERENFISCVMGNKQREILIDRAAYEQIFGEKFNEDYLK